ncbi:MAG: hypothetical protein ACLFPD_01590 [Desulfosudaceae bacterium]
MRKTVCSFILMAVLAFGMATTAAARDTGSWLRSSYLKSIHDDCRVFLEGIELFTERDYAAFLKNTQAGGTISARDADTYVDELRHFEKLLDSVYEEYISFKEASLSAMDKDSAESRELSPMEKRIYQMMAYCYLRTGDIIMAQNIIMNNDILTDDFTIQIRRMDGRMRDFYLTKELTTLYKTTISMLTNLTLHVKNFFVSDIPKMNAYIRVTGYDHNEPVNMLYMVYYGRLLPGLASENGKMIHLGQIIDLFNRLKYSGGSSDRLFVEGEAADFSISYQFPIVKGTYELISNDPTVMVRADGQKEVTVERLCHFKGLARTDFRNLKIAEKQQRQEQTIVKKDFTLFRLDGQSAVSYTTGQMVPYAVYALFEGKNQLGTVELVPCGRGGNCRERATNDPAVTLVKIFDHEFVLYQDVLDLIKSNHNRYGTGVSFNALNDNVQNDTAGGGGKSVGLFPGCASTQ